MDFRGRPKRRLGGCDQALNEGWQNWSVWGTGGDDWCHVDGNVQTKWLYWCELGLTVCCRRVTARLLKLKGWGRWGVVENHGKIVEFCRGTVDLVPVRNNWSTGAWFPHWNASKSWGQLCFAISNIRISLHEAFSFPVLFYFLYIMTSRCEVCCDICLYKERANSGPWAWLVAALSAHINLFEFFKASISSLLPTAVPKNRFNIWISEKCILTETQYAVACAFAKFKHLRFEEFQLLTIKSYYYRCPPRINPCAVETPETFQTAGWGTMWSM